MLHRSSKSRHLHLVLHLKKMFQSFTIKCDAISYGFLIDAL